jgi:hypothetical protein
MKAAKIIPNKIACRLLFIIILAFLGEEQWGPVF